MHALKVIWALAILMLMTLYASASVQFGIRWANLTYRGLISGGVYRISKHPAYLFKNISWWLISLPFLIAPGTDWKYSLTGCALLIGNNTIYYLRAKTEEQHLSRYPEYRAYALWMEDHGWLRFLGKICPALQYNPMKISSGQEF
jgi:steroid 5-alpha reductase family enzyme